jgi:hypothetical protein
MDFTAKKQYPEHYELVDSHIDKYFKEADTSVFHEIPTLDIHLDVYHIKPKNSEFDVLVTSGMSSIAMNVSEIPGDSDRYRFAELMTLIPKGIDFGIMYPSGTKYDWVISMLKQSAKFPHFYDTWIGKGHTIQADADLLPYSKDTNYCGCLVLPSMSLTKGFHHIESAHGHINIYGLFPLYKEELEFKIAKGYSEFMQVLVRNEVEEVIDFNRINYCKKDERSVDKLKRWTKRLF